MKKDLVTETQEESMDLLSSNAFDNIKCHKEWVHITPLNKGWSKDKKYVITDRHDKKYILRISPISLMEKKKKQFEYMNQICKMNISAQRPIEFGVLNNEEIYMLLTYLEGESAQEAISALSNKEAYRLGENAGRMLQKLHSVVIASPAKSWNDKYQEKIKKKIDAINNCSLEIPNKNLIIDYIQKHLCILKDRPQTFCHGDYHLGNMIISNNEIYIIDFDKCNIADPYDDFKPFCWNVLQSEYFETGLVNGYFNNRVSNEFWQVLALYAAESLISHLPWAITFGEQEIKVALEVLESVLKWYNNFNLLIPTWYKGVLDKEEKDKQKR